MPTEKNNGTPEQNQDVLRLVIEEGFNKGNYAALDPLYTTGYQEHQFGLKTTLEGLKEDIHYPVSYTHLTLPTNREV